MTFFDIVLKTGASLHPDGEPDDFISAYTGVIRAEGESGVRRKVGKVRAYRIHAGAAAAAGEPLFDVCDAHSAELHEVHALLYEPGRYHYRGRVADRFDQAGPDTLLLDYVVLHPKWRGLRLGLLAARKMMDLLGGGCGLVVSHIAPLRRDAAGMLRVPQAWLPALATPGERGEGVRRLRRYYRGMGFERLGGTPYYGLSMAWDVPTLAELLRPSAR
jgi:GNAT superfamily N-acetyltransferase